MNLTSKRTFAAVAAAALVIGSVATTSAHAASYKIYIGYQGPLTGDNKQTGLDEIAGVKYALAK
jgi:hypothetical protein